MKNYFFVLCFLISFISFSFSFDLQKLNSLHTEDIGDCSRCHIPIPSNWTTGAIPQTSCGQDGITYDNALCLLTISSINYCLVVGNITGIQYAGNCGCPNHCYNITNQGECVNGKCECENGWKGPDCSQVDCSMNNCSFHGSCDNIEGLDICKCYSGWTGMDCSIPTINPPPITEVVPSTQYSSWDEYGNNHPIFNVSTVAQIRLYMSPDSLHFLLNPINKYTSEYVHTEFNFDNGVTSKNMSDVGIRPKGNSSRGYAKKTFKISFNAFRDDDDNDWDQVDKISLKGFQTDNTYIRESMATAVEYSMNAYIQRTGWAQLYINDINMGYYLIIEEVDGKYLNSRFGDNDGPLYKCTANLTWIGSNPESYANLDCGRNPCYNPKTDAANDYTSLRDLIAVINLTSDEEFPQALEQVFDVDLFIRTFVFEVATGNWDGLRDTNNFYLYQNPGDGLYKYIRHDNDVTFGILPVFQNVVTNHIYHWADSPHPTYGKLLYDRILSIPSYKQKYSQYMQELFNEYFLYEYGSPFQLLAQSYQQLSEKPVLQDQAHYLDSGLTYYTFNNSYTQTFYKPPSILYDGEVLMSLYDFMTQRISSAQNQLNKYFGSY